MKKLYLIFVLIITVQITVWSQNKTLGVGVTTPNPNAALHIESPTGNQGFIMPRLTTAQRTAAGFQGVLSAADAGLMVYDTSLKAIYIWDGAKWQASAKLATPYVDTVLSAPNGANLLRMVYAGSATESVGVAQFENLNPNNGFTPLFARTNSAINGAVDLVVNNTANNNDGIGVSSNGSGALASAGSFTMTGTGVAGRFTVNNPGGLNPALWAQTNSNQPLSAAIYGLNTGTGDVAASFKATNAATTFPALYAETLGTGGAARFVKTSTTGTVPAVFVSSQGGHGLRADHNGATGYAGIFQNVNPANNTPSLFASTASNGAAFRAETDLGGNAVEGRIFNTGTGSAGTFTIDNVDNTNPAIMTSTTGTGPAINAFTAGTGSAGNFVVTDPNNTNPVINASTTGFGAAIRASSPAGLAIDADAGGIRLSATALAAPGALSGRYSVYNLLAGGNYTIDTAGRVDGEIVYVTAEMPVIINGIGAGGMYQVNINAFETKTFVLMKGSWRAEGATQPK